LPGPLRPPRFAFETAKVPPRCWSSRGRGTGRQASHAPHPKGESDERAIASRDEDDCQEAAVLDLVLEIHPAALTVDELNREITGGSRDFSGLDPVHRAVRDLSGSGLLHRPGEEEMVRPTRAALRLYDLWER
jgi:hypothetical protein